jgi:hypothetical protein
MYLRNLHTEISSFRRVKKAAEVIELALSVESNQSTIFRMEIPAVPLNKSQEGKTKGDNHQNHKDNERKTRLNSMSSNSAQPKGKDTPNKKGSP